MLGVRKLIALVEQETREHSLFEAAEYQKKCAGFDNRCDPAGPAPAASVCNGTASDKSETIARLVCERLKSVKTP
jgi:hypothetical protein